MLDNIKDAIDAYAETGRPVGHFLTAVLSNDLAEAIGRADDDNIRNIREIVSYVYMEIPSECWGSPKRVKDWYAKKRKEREAVKG